MAWRRPQQSASTKRLQVQPLQLMEGGETGLHVASPSQWRTSAATRPQSASPSRAKPSRSGPAPRGAWPASADMAATVRRVGHPSNGPAMRGDQSKFCSLSLSLSRSLALSASRSLTLISVSLSLSKMPCMRVQAGDRTAGVSSGQGLILARLSGAAAGRPESARTQPPA